MEENYIKQNIQKYRKLNRLRLISRQSIKEKTESFEFELDLRYGVIHLGSYGILIVQVLERENRK